jgi:hypothetical protein
MSKLDFQDFFFRRLTLGRAGIKSLPESKEVFLKRVELFLKEGNRKLINIETREDGIRIWYQD